MKNLTFLLLTLISNTVFAQWSLISETADTKVYLDFSSIQKTNNKIRVWELFDTPNGSVSPDNKVAYRSSKTLEEYDCSSDNSKTIEFAWYSKGMASGAIVYMDKGSNYPWVSYPPGSVNSAIKQKICSVEKRSSGR